MFISASILRSVLSNACDKATEIDFHNRKKRERAELYDNDYDSIPSLMFKNSGLAIVSAILLFVLELIMMAFAVFIAFRCTMAPLERCVHILLAITFSAPYFLCSCFFSICGKAVLRGPPPPEFLPELTELSGL